MSSSIDKTVLEAAANWYVDLMESPTENALRQAHQTWLDQAPSHRQAWERVTKLQEQLARAQHPLARPTLSTARMSRRRAIKSFSAFFIAGTGLTSFYGRDAVKPFFATYRTGAGDMREIRLGDGSTLHMNTATAVDLQFGEHERTVILHNGEVLITTMVDPAQRPFCVRTREGIVRALGTRFSVFSEEGHSRVEVFKHAVEVRLASAGNPRTVPEGRAHEFTRAEHQKTESIDRYADAWTNRLLIVHDWRLDRFATELGRYAPGTLSVDEKVASLRISGTFNLNDVPAILDNLSATLPVKARRRTRYWTLIEAR